MYAHPTHGDSDRYEIDEIAAWLTVDEFARRAGVATKTVRRWIAADKITAVRMGPKLLRINPNDLSKLSISPAAR